MCPLAKTQHTDIASEVERHRSRGTTAPFDSVIVTPAGTFGTGEADVIQADIDGAIITGILPMGQYGTVHADHALRTMPLSLAPTVGRLTDSSVTEHDSNVTSPSQEIRSQNTGNTMKLLRKLNTAVEGESAVTVIHECRRCGTTVDRAASTCPYCGPTDIVTYYIT